MTKSEFLSLSAYQQEEFINSGGVIESSAVAADNVSNIPSIVNTNAWTSSSRTSTVNVENVGSNPTPSPSVDDTASKGQTSSDEPQPFSSPIQGTSSFDGYLFDSPYELLLTVDPDMLAGFPKCHAWQIQIMRDFALCVKGGKGVSDENPFQAVVRAANGSGKDQFIIASCAVWLMMRYKWGTAVVTSASGQQLDNQTCKHIKNLCLKVNKTFKVDFGFPFEVWDLKYREYTCLFGSEDASDKSSMYCYATDEPRKAEGYHPTKPGAKLGIFASEDKTIPDDINIALNKCTGYTHRLHVSTPGLMLGHFYEYCQIAPMRETLDTVNVLEPIDWVQYWVPASKCSHLRANYFKQMERDLPGGKHGAAYRSQVDAEFSSAETNVVIPFIYIHRAIEGKTEISWVSEPFNTAGLDLSDGGDETVLVIRNGNKIIELLPFKFEDTQDTIKFLDEKFKEHKLDNTKSRIWADCGGIGKPMLDTLRAMGWKNIRYVDNRATPNKPMTYLNRGSELFFSLRDKLEFNSIILVNDDKLVRQLGGRYYKLRADGKHQLLSKQEQKSKGYPSPDRADATNLCFWNYNNPTVDREVKEDGDLVDKTTEKDEVKHVAHFDLRVASGNRKSSFEEVQKKIVERKINFSLLQEEIDAVNARIRNN